ncbi:hypothetical protein JKP88DRAFT_337968 [Tribonema minus]|uniref:Uncharacterized protein n=1 Tax=Tribonema minus TaxID=303371 RepID=A0A836C799_9STRA|nr:hypothetical protein JKP88DRAFT_337968 [Tribonema minus]
MKHRGADRLRSSVLHVWWSSLLLLLLCTHRCHCAQSKHKTAPAASSAAVIAVTIDGSVWTLDAWTGEVRGTFGSGGSVVTSTEDAKGTARVIPGLDGLLFSMGENGQLTVLPSSAPDLVLEPHCLSLEDGGVVEDKECVLLIGEKTTAVYRVDPASGAGGKVGEAPPKPPRGGRRAAPPPPPPQPAALLLQRDDYVVRALDANTAQEMWNVTVAHFTALDMGGGGWGVGGRRGREGAAAELAYANAGEEVMRTIRG